MNEIFRGMVLGLWTFLLLCSANAAEYSDADNIPEITSLLFTRSSVALTLEPYYSGGQVGETDRTRYFIANRTNYEFRQVPREEFAKLMNKDHVQNHTSSYENRDYELTVSQRCFDFEFRNSMVRKEFKIESVTIDVSMLCKSSISDAVLLNDELWIATYEQGGHGEYAAEGVLVASRDGEITSRIDVGNYPTERFVIDPWSTDVWVVTRSQLTVVSEDKEVKTRYWPYHDIDLSQNRPDIFVVISEEGVANNPLAILANSLGESSYEGFSNAHRAGVKLTNKNTLYNFFMFGNYYIHRPQLPAELSILLDAAEPTVAWRRFACMSFGRRAEVLCDLEPKKWPASEM